MKKLSKRFVAFDYDILSANGYVLQKDVVDKDGQVLLAKGSHIKITPADKMIYSLMLSRYKYFVLEKKSQYYDTQEAIGQSLCIERRTVLEKLKVLMQNGVIEGVKKKFSNYMSWNYTKINELVLYWEVVKRVNGKDEEQIVYKNPFDSMESKPQAQKPVDKPYWLDEDDDDPGPF